MAEHSPKLAIVDKHATIESGRLPEMHGSTIVEQIHIERYRYALSSIGGGAVLDIASGIGYGTNMLAQDARVKSVTGVDVSKEAIAKARSAFAAPNLRFELVDGNSLPFADESFDAIVSFETIEHTADPHAFLAELRRVLRTGGALVISTPNKRFHSHRKRAPWNPFHTVEYYPEEFRGVLRSVFPNITFWGGQEFLETGRRDVLRYNWVEFRYYNLDHHPLLSKIVTPLKQLKRSVAGSAKDAGAPPDPALLRFRTAVVPAVEGREAFTMVARCTK